MSIEFKNLSKVFNSKTLNDIANGDFSYLNKIANDFSIHTESLVEFYDKAYSLLELNYANEYVFKNLIANKILRGKHSLNTATMLTEFRVGLNKADCVILNGKSTCYEIKTDFDSLVRLEDQLNTYQQLFDEVYVVCSDKYKCSLLEQLPEKFGIIFLTEKLTLKTLRKASPRNMAINRKMLIESMRQAEYKLLAEEISGEKISLPNTVVFEKCASIIDSFSDEVQLNDKYIEILKKSRKNNDTFINRIPKSLTNAAISYRFSKKELNSLIHYFNNQGAVKCTTQFFEENKMNC